MEIPIHTLNRQHKLSFPEELIQRRHEMAPTNCPNNPSQFLHTSRVWRFFAHDSHPPQLTEVAHGNDSEVYVYHDRTRNTDGILKLYGSHITVEMIQRYQRIMENIAGKSDLFSPLDCTFILNNKDRYQVTCEIVPFDRIEERNGIVATLTSEQGWIRGENLASLTDGRLNESHTVECVTDETRRGIENISPMARPEVDELCDTLTTRIHAILGDNHGWTLVPANIKLRIDHQAKKVHLLITDLADELRLI
ncbi:MAG: hypothetical protein PHO20_01060 [Candidatus Peribacteraceae bacterium]|nr:hypothetical protein [Candidatus Peribacteraceae bacterium]MDD5739339.1 hypothetical protein [Candidatus Peribacteraceae bacterium]